MPIPSKRLRTGIFRTIYGKKYPALNEAEFGSRSAISNPSTRCSRVR